MGATGTRSIRTPSIPSQRSTALRADGTAATPPPEHEDRERDRPAPAASGGAAAARASSRARTRAGHVGLGRPLDAQLGEAGLELAHSSSSSRASARDTRDLTVPGRQPSAAAVSRSDRPSR